MKALPATAAALIQELDASHPARCIAANEDLVAAHRYAGARDMIESLIRRLKAVNTIDPTKPLLEGRDVHV